MNRRRHAAIFRRSLCVILLAFASAAVAAAGIAPSLAAAAPGAHGQHSAHVVQRPKLRLRHHPRPAAHASARHHSR